MSRLSHALDELASWGFPIVGEWSLRALLVTALAVAILAALRPRRPAVRQMIWLTVLLSFLAVPLAQLLAPRLELPVLAAKQAAAPVSTDEPARARGSLPEAIEVRPAVHAPDVPDVPPQAAMMERLPPAPPPSVTAPPAARQWTWGNTLIVVYLLGAITMGLWTLCGFLASRYLLSRSAAIETGCVRELVGAIAAKMALRRPVRLAASPSLAVPITCGLVRPVVVLPTEYAEGATLGLEAVLAHELAHVKRSSYLTLLFSRLVECLWWFHPCAWLASRRVAREEELVADHLARMASTRGPGRGRRS